MKGELTRFIAFMEGPKKRFVIPVYQRNYDWKEENCKQLYDDLKKLIKNGRKAHFLGSIVSCYNPDGSTNEEFLIIDGQQRITTLSILLLAIHNLLKQGKVYSNDKLLADQISERFLIDKYSESEDKKIKLKLIKNDRDAFNKLFQQESYFQNDSNLTINYNYFKKEILKEEISIDELYNAICRLEIISISLKQDEDDPQLIFESLNSTGMDLTEGDKIRNFILMGMDSKSQNRCYEDFWLTIEQNTKYDVSAFIKDYLTIKINRIPTKNKVYVEFKDYFEKNFEKNRLNRENVLDDLCFYSKFYNILLDGNTDNKTINSCIKRLNQLETTVSRPFFLEVLRMHDSRDLNDQDVIDIFRLIESFIFRRIICECPTNALNKIFLYLHNETFKCVSPETTYLKSLKQVLLSKHANSRFPNDSEFQQCFATKNIYQMRPKNKIYLFERLENGDSLEDKDIYRHCEDGTYSIEHIMPQTLSPIWEEELGVNYNEIHQEWCDTIANLTLTAYNSKYSNKSFNEKRDMKCGYAQSGIKLNQFIASKQHWTENELKERCDILKEQAVKVWPFPKDIFRQEDLQEFTLEDDIDFRSKKIFKFSFDSIEKEVSTWIEMFLFIIKTLHKKDPSVLIKLACDNENTNELAKYIAYKTNNQMNKKIREKKLIDDKIYIEGNTDTMSKIRLLRSLFDKYGVNQDELLFYLKSE